MEDDDVVLGRDRDPNDDRRRRLRGVALRSTRHGNNPLVGDVGNMSSLTDDARSDGRELLGILDSTLMDLSNLIYLASSSGRPSSSSGGHRVGDGRNDDDANASGRRSTTTTTASGKEISEVASRAIDRASELRDFVARVRTKVGGDGDNNDGGQQDGGGGGGESDDVGADAVRHRLEREGGSGASAAALTSSSPSSASGMVLSVVRAIMSMIDPPPHKSIFGLDVMRGCFLARYRGARQFWVNRAGAVGSGSRASRWWLCAGGGKLDVIVIPSSTNGRYDRGVCDDSAESFLPLSPRKGRGEEMIGNGKNVGEKRGRPYRITIRMPGLVGRWLLEWVLPEGTSTMASTTTTTKKGTP